ncbi:CASP-like protein 2A1 [Nymphaea thermarum]|nr:CASP-like protein 2A1 [Nymphaea thermarum]
METAALAMDVVKGKGAVQGGVPSPEMEETREEASGICRISEMLLRVLPMALSVAALLVMLKNRQNADDFGSVAYTDVGGFRYLVYANGLCAVYSLVSALCVAMPRSSSKSCSRWAFFLLDQVVTYLILAAGTVCTEVIYLSYNGDLKITWGEACSTFGTFCRKATASVAITFAALLCYILLSLLSSHRLFSTFAAPCSTAYAGRVEAAASPFSG